MFSDGIWVENFGKLSHLYRRISSLCTYLRNARNNYAALGGNRDFGTQPSTEQRDRKVQPKRRHWQNEYL
jgi:hypothetical protein